MKADDLESKRIVSSVLPDVKWTAFGSAEDLAGTDGHLHGHPVILKDRRKHTRRDLPITHSVELRDGSWRDLEWATAGGHVHIMVLPDTVEVRLLPEQRELEDMWDGAVQIRRPRWHGDRRQRVVMLDRNLIPPLHVLPYTAIPQDTEL